MFAVGWVRAQQQGDGSSGWPNLGSGRIRSDLNCSNRRSHGGDRIASGSSHCRDLHLEINGRCTYRGVETTNNHLDQKENYPAAST